MKSQRRRLWLVRGERRPNPRRKRRYGSVVSRCLGRRLLLAPVALRRPGPGAKAPIRLLFREPSIKTCLDPNSLVTRRRRRAAVAVFRIDETTSGAGERRGHCQRRLSVQTLKPSRVLPCCRENDPVDPVHCFFVKGPLRQGVGISRVWGSRISTTPDIP